MVGTVTLPPKRHEATTELIFRVRGSSRDSQIVRLKTRKCSIGSGRQSTLRLRARGVAPLHCLIIRGTERTVVRRWSSDTRLNGRAFSDAELKPGDRLSIGPIDLDVLFPGLETDAIMDHLATALSDASPSDTVREQADDDQPAIDRHIGRLKQANREARRRARRLVEQLRHVNQEVVRLKEEVEVASAEATPCQSSAVDSGAARRRSDQDARERQQWLEEQATREEELRCQEDHISSLRAEMDERREAWEARCREWDTQRDQSQQQLSEQAQRLKERQEELEAQQRDLERDLKQRSRRPDSDSPHAEDETTSPMARFQASFQQEPVSDRQPVSELEIVQDDDAPASMDGPWDEYDSDIFGGGEISLEDIPAKPTDDGLTPTDDGLTPTDDDLTPTDDDLAPADRTFEPPLSSPSPLPVAEEEPGKPLDEDEEESINDYMTRLMQRVQGPAGASELVPMNEKESERAEIERPSTLLDTAMPASSQPSVEPARSRQPEPSSKQPDEPSKTESNVSESSPPTSEERVEMSPRAVAAERSMGLSAMRELANLSAQSAIDHHARRQVKIGQRGRLVMAVLAAVTGVVLLNMRRSYGMGVFAVYIAVFSFVAAGFWGAGWITTAVKQWFGGDRDASKFRGRDEAAAEDIPGDNQ